MKNTVAFVFVALFGSFAFAGEPHAVVVPLQRSYIPSGFDSNDVVQLAVEGAFPSTCYRAGVAQARMIPGTQNIEITASAMVYDEPCLDVMVPFTHVLTIGPLPAGKYSIVQRGGVVLGDLNIAATQNVAADDFLYAPVTQSWFQPGVGGGQLVMSGVMPLSCMGIQDVKVNVEPRVIVIQPIVKVANDQNCRRGYFPFQKNISLKSIPTSRYLLHIRVMNGQALSSMIDIR